MRRVGRSELIVTSEESKEKVCAYGWKNDRYEIISCIEAFVGKNVYPLYLLFYYLFDHF